MSDTQLDLVTGGSSYTGRHIATRLLSDGHAIRTLTAHPQRDPALARRIEVQPYRFDNPVELAGASKA